MMKQCKPFQDPYQIFKAFNLISKLNNVVQKLSTASNTQKKQLNCLVWFADNKLLFVSPFLHLHFSLQPKRQMYKDSYHP